jgi:hypothetical protein
MLLPTSALDISITLRVEIYDNSGRESLFCGPERSFWGHLAKIT